MSENIKHERDYARLKDLPSAKKNRYGADIELTKAPGESLNINGDASVGTSANRNKQHGFHFTADNCIGCHACEAACSEKNDLPPHLAFRSVGYVEGGSWPDYTRVNISMACNHCDDPVCLKGCPTRAYTKHPEFGAVIQDPDICFGCGYCTWVCPYNAPQLDPVEGHVQKCNMCVDRLEVGLKPACVSACLGNALDFGVIENTPEGREQTKTHIPGFPDPSITHPNIRFEQTKSLPQGFTRPDSAAVKYHRKDGSGLYAAEIDEAKILGRAWGIKQLNSRENPLVVFTLTTQAVIGAFILLFLGPYFGLSDIRAFAGTWGYEGFLVGLLGLQGFALFLSTLHLGKPWRFYRGFNNLRHSPLSREALGVALFFACAAGYTLLHLIQKMGLFPVPPSLFLLSGSLGVLFGLGGLYFMSQIYRIKARPFWDHWQVSATFFGTALSVGSVLLALALMIQGEPVPDGLAVPLLIGLLWEGCGLWCHARDLKRHPGEGAASYRVQTSQFFGAYLIRNALLFVNLLTALSLAAGWGSPSIWAGLMVSVPCMAAIGRALFYVLVIPTTMPGAFFWKNKAFEDHARESGLADRPQCGVATNAH